MESPILVLYGEDTYSLKQAEQELVDRLVDPGFASLNLNVIEGTTTPPSQVVSAALTMPFGPGARVVLVRDCPYFGTGRFEGSDEVEAIAELADRGLPEGCHLILSVSGSVDRRLSFTKSFFTKVAVREFPAAKPWDDGSTVDWLMATSRDRHYKLSIDAAHTIVDTLGHDRWKLEAELEKLATYADGQPITMETVRLLGSPGESDVFEVLAAISRREPAKALSRLRTLLVTEPALKVLSTMVTMMRRWLAVKLHAEKGLGQEAIAKALGSKSSYGVQRDLEQCRNWTSRQLQAALERLLETDLALKRGARGHETFLLEALVARLSAI